MGEYMACGSIVASDCLPPPTRRRHSNQEMRKIDECDMEKFGTLDSSGKTIAILGDSWWPHTAKQEGDKINQKVST